MISSEALLEHDAVGRVFDELVDGACVVHSFLLWLDTIANLIGVVVDRGLEVCGLHRHIVAHRLR